MAGTSPATPPVGSAGYRNREEILSSRAARTPALLIVVPETTALGRTQHEISITQIYTERCFLTKAMFPDLTKLSGHGNILPSKGIGPCPKPAVRKPFTN